MGMKKTIRYAELFKIIRNGITKSIWDRLQALRLVEICAMQEMTAICSITFTTRDYAPLERTTRFG